MTNSDFRFDDQNRNSDVIEEFRRNQRFIHKAWIFGRSWRFSHRINRITEGQRPTKSTRLLW